ncbi:MAG: LamG-like jellyroll fold domain-containing protein [Myxococcota bacterium]
MGTLKRPFFSAGLLLALCMSPPVLAAPVLDTPEAGNGQALENVSGDAALDVRGYWRLDGNLGDSSAWNNPAQLRPARYVSGRSGQALALSGRTVAMVPYDESLRMDFGLSLDLWIKLNSYGQEATLIGSGSALKEDSNWSLGFSQGSLSMQYRTANGSLGVLSVAESRLPLNTWVHVGAWVSLAEGEVGLVVHTDSMIASLTQASVATGKLSTSALDLMLGENFKGSLDEVKLTVLEP